MQDPNRLRCPACWRRLKPSTIEERAGSFVCENARCGVLGVFVALADAGASPEGAVSNLRRAGEIARLEADGMERVSKLGLAAGDPALGEIPGLAGEAPGALPGEHN